MSGEPEGKVAAVTGGNSGVGPATAKEFARGGARVAIAGLTVPGGVGVGQAAELQAEAA